MKKGHRRTNS